jgi:hypothetical protein
MWVYIYKKGAGKFNSLEHHYLQTISYAKSILNDKEADITKIHQTQRNTGLVCAVLKVTSYSL